MQGERVVVDWRRGQEREIEVVVRLGQGQRATRVDDFRKRGSGVYWRGDRLPSDPGCT